MQGVNTQTCGFDVCVGDWHPASPHLAFASTRVHPSAIVTVIVPLSGSGKTAVALTKSHPPASPTSGEMHWYPAGFCSGKQAPSGEIFTE
jgi:hypothetical protein